MHKPAGFAMTEASILVVSPGFDRTLPMSTALFWAK